MGYPGIWRGLQVLAGIGVASVAVACWYGGLTGSLRGVPVAFVVALAHGLLFGLPLSALHWHFRWIGWLACGLSGALAGIAGLLVLTLATTVGSTGGQDWVSAIRAVPLFASFGILGGLVFRGWLQLAESLPLAGPSPGNEAGPSLLRSGALLGVAVALVAGIWAIEPAIRDRSCHQLPLDDPEAVVPRLALALDIPDDEWPMLRGLLAEEAKSQGWSFRDSSEELPEVRTLYLSLCNDQGLLVWVGEQRWVRPTAWLPPDRDVDLVIYEARPGSGWEVHARRLQVQLEERWPGRVR